MATSSLVVVGVGGDEAVVWAGLERHHEPLHVGVDLPRQVRGGDVPRDELVGDADDVPEVGGEPEAEDGELVPLEGVLEGAARRVHAVVGRHEGVLRDAFLVALPQQRPDVPVGMVARWL